MSANVGSPVGVVPDLRATRLDCARPLAERVRRPNVAFSRAAEDLAVGGSIVDPSLVLSDDGGGRGACPGCDHECSIAQGHQAGPLRPTETPTLPAR